MKTRKLFSKYGQPVRLARSGGEVNYRAFIQPLRYKNKLYLRGVYTGIGKNKEDYYLYIGPPGIDVSSVDGMANRLYAGDTEYLVYRTERHDISGEEIYIWAIIRPVIPDEEGGTHTPGEGAVG